MLEILCHIDAMTTAPSLVRRLSTHHPLSPDRQKPRDTLHFLHFTLRRAMTIPRIPIIAGADPDSSVGPNGEGGLAPPSALTAQQLVEGCTRQPFAAKANL
jgi:hypothetical protein